MWIMVVILLDFSIGVKSQAKFKPRLKLGAGEPNRAVGSRPTGDQSQKVTS